MAVAYWGADESLDPRNLHRATWREEKRGAMWFQMYNHIQYMHIILRRLYIYIYTSESSHIIPVETVIPISSYPHVMKPIAPYCAPVACRGTKLVKVLNTNGDEQRAGPQWMSSRLPVSIRLRLNDGAGITIGKP